MSLCLLILDGARPDTLARALDAGHLPAFAALRDHGGGLHVISSVFPSVTGPAYLPFLTGRFPGPVGLPGIRWLDRSGTAARPRARSYVGWEMRFMDRDLDPAVRTLFELAPPGMGTMQVIRRGLSPGASIGTTAGQELRAAWNHFRGGLGGWLAIDRDGAELAARHVRLHRPAFSMVCLQSGDKLSHARTQEHPLVLDAWRIADAFAARVLHEAQADGRPLRLWVASDHGHSALLAHDDLALALRAEGYRVLAHPWTFTRRWEIAVMVSGNAMAHLYLGSAPPTPSGSRVPARHHGLVDWLLARPSVDLLAIPDGAGGCTLHTRGRGAARLHRDARDRYHYTPHDGDPLALGGRLHALDREAAHQACADTGHPDALVQLTHLATSARAGDVILSAAPGYDFRERWEPIAHTSTHGALHRDHMAVPLLLDAPPVRAPRRTTDVCAAALRVLGATAPPDLDGASFYD